MGRGAQIDAVAERLLSDRLITLTGAGGIGKTRLAQQVARVVRSEYASCSWTTLSSTTDDAGVGRAVASALCGSEYVPSSSIDVLISCIRDHKLILILDNCEHVIAACADLVLRLLQECPGIHVLATSREPLGVPGEVVYPVPPLALDAAGSFDGQVLSEATQLFFERAQVRDPELRPTPDAHDIAVRICSALNGVPLAIELAAACTSSMSLSEIDDRLDDVLGLLRIGSRATPPRQHSVRASIDWSHSLLQDSERCLLRRLALLGDDFTLAAAEAVCAFDGMQVGEIAFLLDRLVAQSLVQVSKHGSTTRFRLFLSVRQYGLERLEQAGELARMRTHLAEWYEGRGPTTVAADAAPGAVAAPVTADPSIERPRAAAVPARGGRQGVLSEREHEVVLLVAGGRSNREIADELVITRKTAEAHVSHILTKLGLCSRVQIAMWSLQHGLVHGDHAAVAGR